MCFGSKDAQGSGGPPPRPIPGSSAPNNYDNSNDMKKSNYNPQQSQPPPQPLQLRDDYAPPPGPPPGERSRPVAAPAVNEVADFAPPPGPPPSYGSGGGAGDYAPPLGPPPGRAQQEGPKVHDWESAVPDNSLLPPPPNLFAGWDRSPTNNATESEAEAGQAWCKQFPLNFPPMDLQHNQATQQAIKTYNINLQRPPGYLGKLSRGQDGTWFGETTRRSPDSSLIGFPPLYAPSLHSPRLETRGYKPFTMYYEVHIAEDNREEVSLAMGFAAMPYPAFRLPGWHRGSVAVHGDDGYRYTNDMWGGKTMKKKFLLQPGKAYGIGMRFSYDMTAQTKIAVEVFFVDCDMKDIVASWDLHEETDAQQDLPVVGLEGLHDLSVAIGTFDAVKFEVHLNPAQWKYEKMRNQKYAEME